MDTRRIKLLPNDACLDFYVENKAFEKRPAVIIMPGGAYRYTAMGEAEPVAIAYAHYGFNSFVLHYSVMENTGINPCKNKDEVIDAAISDGCSAFDYIYGHAEELKVDTNKIVLVGFSAGANLALATCLIGKRRPSALILGYGAYGKESLNNLGVKAYDLISLVDENTCPTFLFMTQGDTTVSSLETLKLAVSLKENKVPYEIHGFVAGDHGFSLGLDVNGVVNKSASIWHQLSLEFLNNIWRDTPLILGDISNDLNHPGIDARIGALMYEPKYYQLLEEILPDLLFKAKTSATLKGITIRKAYTWNLIKEPRMQEVIEAFEKIKK